MLKRHEKAGGFTLVELLLALFISSVMVAAIFSFFIAQNRSYSQQDQLIQMHQNLRAAVNLMVKEIRMAGYDPTGKADAGIVTAKRSIITFTMDMNSDANCNDTNERITYSLYKSKDRIRKLGRKTTGRNAPVAENIEALGLAYAFDSDGDGSFEKDKNQIIWAIEEGGRWFDLDTNDDGKIDSGDNVAVGEDTGITVNLDDIRAVRIWLLIKTSKVEEGYINNKIYIVGNKIIRPGSDADSSNDNVRMRLVETIVRLRNMAL